MKYGLTHSEKEIAVKQGPAMSCRAATYKPVRLEKWWKQARMAGNFIESQQKKWGMQ